MKIVLSLLVLFATSSSFAQTSGTANCPNPNPQFGKIVALCNNLMLTYTGDSKETTLGIPTTTSRFEVVECSSNMRDLGDFVQRSYDYFDFTSQDGQLQIKKDSSTFGVTTLNNENKKVTIACTPYNDTRSEIKYLWTDKQ